MTKKKHLSTRDLSARDLKGLHSVVNTNPLSAELPTTPVTEGSGELPEVDEGTPSDDSETAVEAGNHSLPGVNPSEFDPDSEPDLMGTPTGNLPHIDPEFSPEEEEEIRLNTPSTGVDHLGRPAEPGFNPRDTSKGFYQGIDPSTGERVFSK